MTGALDAATPGQLLCTHSPKLFEKEEPSDWQTRWTLLAPGQDATCLAVIYCPTQANLEAAVGRPGKEFSALVDAKCPPSEAPPASLQAELGEKAEN